MRISLVTILVAALVPAATIGAERAVVPFELLDDGSVVIAVFIDGAGPFRFVLDTGSTRSVVSPQLAEKLRLPAIARSSVITPSGDDRRPVVQLRGVVIDGLPPVNVAAVVAEHLDIAAGRRVHGLLGQDVLAPLVYTIDYRRREVRWNAELDPAAAGVRLPLVVADGIFLVSLSHRGSREPLRLIADSGTSAFVLFTRRSQKLPRLTPLGIGALQTVGGRAPARHALLEAVWVGSILLKNQPAMIVPQARDARLGDGLLPLHVFGRVTFDGPGRYLVVEAR